MKFFVRYDVSGPGGANAIESEKTLDLGKAIFDLKAISTFERVQNARLVIEEEVELPAAVLVDEVSWDVRFRRGDHDVKPPSKRTTRYR